MVRLLFFLFTELDSFTVNFRVKLSPPQLVSVPTQKFSEAGSNARFQYAVTEKLLSKAGESQWRMLTRLYWNFRASRERLLHCTVDGRATRRPALVPSVGRDGRMEQLLSMQSVLRKLNAGIQPLADCIMTLVLELIKVEGKTSTVLEDAFLVVGTLAATLKANFLPYIQVFLPYLYPALKAHEGTQLCTVAIGIIGNISRTLGPQDTQVSVGRLAPHHGSVERKLYFPPDTKAAVVLVAAGKAALTDVEGTVSFPMAVKDFNPTQKAGQKDGTGTAVDWVTADIPAYDVFPGFGNLPGCAWSVWGAEEKLGTVNLLTDAVVKTAGKLVSLNW
ncbi:hypothetical protein B0H14DRAFT_2575457 [Mycena olivaceomarginata]|nr:hypothetical protein B0H14DRAFT_2575457 [Mycena olivaceomarginata]